MLPDILSVDQVERLTLHFNNSWARVKANWEKLQWRRRLYREKSNPTFCVGRVLYERLRAAEFGGVSVWDMGNARYDISEDGELQGEDNGRLGVGVEGTALAKEICEVPLVAEMLKEVLGGCGITAHMGGLPVESSVASYGKWHRDQCSLFEDEHLDISLPTFYLTMLVPLIDLSDPNEGNGTEFVLGSHKVVFADKGFTSAEQVNEWAANQSRYAPPLSLGSALIFHGNLLHRGVPSQLKCRPMIYFVFKKSWYSEDPAEYVEFDIPAGGDEKAEAEVESRAREDLNAIENSVRLVN